MINRISKLFGTNGVRGTFGTGLTLDFIVDFTYALASYYKNGPIIVGRDGRMSSQIISRIIRSTLNSGGLEVGYAGLIPTPCLQYAAKRLGYFGGVMVTASHNPPEYNMTEMEIEASSAMKRVRYNQVTELQRR